MNGATKAAKEPVSPAEREAGEPSFARRLNPAKTAQRFALPVIWLVMIAVFGIIEPSTFLQSKTFASIFSTQSVIVVLTLGLILPLTADEYDLSIATNLGFCTTLIAALNVNSGVPIVW